MIQVMRSSRRGRLPGTNVSTNARTSVSTGVSTMSGWSKPKPGSAAQRTGCGEIAVASNFRAVQSTPLTARDGRLVGMLSTHYPRPVALPDRELRIIGQFGALIGERLCTLLDMEGRSPGE